MIDQDLQDAIDIGNEQNRLRNTNGSTSPEVPCYVRVRNRVLHVMDGEGEVVMEYIDSLRDGNQKCKLANGELLECIKATYRKHVMSDDSIGWDELGDMLLNTLANAMGDDDFAEWKG